jgi:hypothetical protein
MPLPIQWHGPLGWLQFRPSTEGCVVEFRRRAQVDNQLDASLHKYYSTLPRPHEPQFLIARLWWTISALMLKDGKALYIGGFDREHFEIVRRKVEQVKGKLENALIDEDPSDHRPDDGQNKQRAGTTLLDTSPEDLFDELLRSNLTREEIILRVQTGRKLETHPPKAASQSTRDNVFDFVRGLKKEAGIIELLKPCPGLLSTVSEGELADVRGLNIQNCIEYHRIPEITLSRIDQEKLCYSIGDLRMDRELLAKIKEAMEMLTPDGFFFTPTGLLSSTLKDIFSSLSPLMFAKKQTIFTDSAVQDWPPNFPYRDELFHAMLLCNNFEEILSKGNADFTVNDMVIMAKAAHSLRKTMSTPPDLCWAMIICPKLFKDLAEFFENSFDVKSFDGKVVKCSQEVLDCTEILKDALAQQDNDGSSGPTYTYETPLCNDGSYTGWELLAAFTNLIITYDWFRKRWRSEVGVYDHVIPQSITFC